MKKTWVIQYQPRNACFPTGVTFARCEAPRATSPDPTKWRHFSTRHAALRWLADRACAQVNVQGYQVRRVHVADLTLASRVVRAVPPRAVSCAPVRRARRTPMLLA